MIVGDLVANKVVVKMTFGGGPVGHGGPSYSEMYGGEESGHESIDDTFLGSVIAKVVNALFPRILIDKWLKNELQHEGFIPTAEEQRNFRKKPAFDLKTLAAKCLHADIRMLVVTLFLISGLIAWALYMSAQHHNDSVGGKSFEKTRMKEAPGSEVRIKDNRRSVQAGILRSGVAPESRTVPHVSGALQDGSTQTKLPNGLAPVAPTDGYGAPPPGSEYVAPPYKSQYGTAAPPQGGSDSFAETRYAPQNQSAPDSSYLPPGSFPSAAPENTPAQQGFPGRFSAGVRDRTSTPDTARDLGVRRQIVVDR